MSGGTFGSRQTECRSGARSAAAVRAYGTARDWSTSRGLDRFSGERDPRRAGQLEVVRDANPHLAWTTRVPSHGVTVIE